MSDNPTRTFQLVVVETSRVTTTKTIKADSAEDAKLMFDNGDWHSIAEEVGDCLEVHSENITEITSP